MKSVLLLCFGLVLLYSCNKKTEDSKTDLLTERPWKFIKIESRMNNEPWFDEVPTWEACEKDDELVFMRDHSYTLRNGATKCDPFDPDVFDVATWNFLDNESKLDMDGEVTTVEVLNRSQLILYASETVGGDSFQYRYTLQH